MYRLLVSLHIFVGLGAFVGGLAAILNPFAPLGAPVEALQYSPFENYLVPGIILFAVVGLGNITSASLLFTNSRFGGLTSHILGWVLVTWIIVQVLMLKGVHFLHLLFFAIGIAQATLSVLLMFKHCTDLSAK